MMESLLLFSCMSASDEGAIICRGGGLRETVVLGGIQLSYGGVFSTALTTLLP